MVRGQEGKNPGKARNLSRQGFGKLVKDLELNLSSAGFRLNVVNVCKIVKELSLLESAFMRETVLRSLRVVNLEQKKRKRSLRI
jgi:hypothetical protein